MNIVNEKQKACISDILNHGMLIRENAALPFLGSSKHDGKTVKSLIDRGVLISQVTNHNGYPMQVAINDKHEIIEALNILGAKIYFINQNRLVGGLTASGLAFKGETLFFSISFGPTNSYYPFSSIRSRTELMDINFCSKCQHGIMWARPGYFFPEVKAGLHFTIKCNHCGHGNGLQWDPSLIARSGIINIEYK